MNTRVQNIITCVQQVNLHSIAYYFETDNPYRTQIDDKIPVKVLVDEMDLVINESYEDSDESESNESKNEDQYYRLC